MEVVLNIKPLLIFLLFCICELYSDSLIKSAQPIELLRTPKNEMVIPFYDKIEIELDGDEKEDIWRKAFVFKNWIKYPQGGKDRAFDAVIKFLCDKDFIYVYFNIESRSDRDFKLLKPNPKRKDGWGSSILELFFDPTGKGKDKVHFCANAVGLRYDSFKDNRKWHGDWKSVGKCEILSSHQRYTYLPAYAYVPSWSVEIKIPAKDLGFESFKEGQLIKGNFGYHDKVNGSDVHDLDMSWNGRWGSPQTDFGKFFIGKKSKTFEHEPILLLMDKEVYDPRDQEAVAVVSLIESFPSEILNIQILKNGKSIRSHFLKNLKKREFDISLNMEGIKEGDYQLSASFINKGKLVASKKVPFSIRPFFLRSAAKTSGEIKIRIPPVVSKGKFPWPVSLGVPFTQGSLFSKDHLRLLDEDGVGIPLQTYTRNRWTRNGSIRWLGIDFQANLSKKEKVYILKYGKEFDKINPMNAIQVDSSEKYHTIDTGKFKFKVNRKSFALIDEAWLDKDGNGQYGENEKVIHLSDKNSPYLIDHQLSRFETASDPDVNVSIEEVGPMMVLLKAEGWYVRVGTKGERVGSNYPTDRLCKFVYRIKAYAGKAKLDISAATIVTYDSTNIRLRDLAIPFNFGMIKEVNLGTNGKKDLVWNRSRIQNNPYIVQETHDRSRDDLGKNHSQVKGWFSIHGKNAFANLVARNFWQRFPNEVGVEGGTFKLHLWPAHNLDQSFSEEEELNEQKVYLLRFAHQGRELNFTMPERYYPYLDKLSDKQKASKYYKEMRFANAQGMTLHSDFSINFKSQLDEGPGAELFYEMVQNDYNVSADPAYVCNTGVFGPIYHADKKYGVFEDTMDKNIDHIFSRTQINDEYGKFVFGNWHHYWMYYKKQPFAFIHRVWDNGHYQTSRIPLIQFARTGDVKYRKLIRDRVDHSRDISTINYVSDDLEIPAHFLGAMYHVKGFAVWSGDSDVAAHTTHVDYLLYDYYLNGNRHSLDTFNRWVDGLKKVNRSGRGGRDGATPLAEMVEAYQHNFDAQLIEFMNRYDQAIFKFTTLQNQGWVGYHPFLLSRYHNLKGSMRIVDAYRLFKDKDRFYGNMFIDPYIAMFDKKKDVTEKWAKEIFRISRSSVRRPGEYGDGIYQGKSLEFSYVFHKFPIALKAMNHFGISLDRPRYTEGLAIPVDVNTKLATVIVRENRDQDIGLKLNINGVGRGKKGNMVVRVYDSKENMVLDKKHMIKKGGEILEVIPSDNRTDDYRVEVKADVGYVSFPLSSLPEVSVMEEGNLYLLNTVPRVGGRFFCSQEKNKLGYISISTRSKSALGMEVLNEDDQVIKFLSDSRYLRGADRLWKADDIQRADSFYFSQPVKLSVNKSPLTVAIKKENLFQMRR